MRRPGIRRCTRIAALALATAIAVGAPTAASAATTIAGSGTASGTGCSGPVQVSASSADDHTWVLQVSYAGVCTSSSLIAPTAALTAVSGTWRPDLGGCVPSAAGTVCLGAVKGPGSVTPKTATLSFCMLADCYGGTVSVYRT